MFSLMRPQYLFSSIKQKVEFFSVNRAFRVLSETQVPEEVSHMASSSSCPAQLAGLTLVLGGILGGQGLTHLSLWNNEMVRGQRRLREVAGIRGL